MKHPLHMLALTMACILPAAMASPAAAWPQDRVKDEPGRSPHHHQLIELKFVLVRPPPEPQGAPHFDFGTGQATIRPSPLWNRYAVPVGRDYLSPNMYWCSGWGCMDARH